MSSTAHFWRAEEIWPGATIAILGGGPSLTQQQVDRLRGRVKVIAINDQIRLAPWADLHYFCDRKWWQWHRDKPWYREFAGIRVTMENPDIVAAEPAVKSLRNYGWDPKVPEQVGLTKLRDGLLTGRFGGYQAINLGVHLGGKLLLLLGFDMRDDAGRSHWFGEHPDGTGRDTYKMGANFDHLVQPLAKLGVKVLNCTPGSALRAFPQATLESVLPDPQPAALSA